MNEPLPPSSSTRWNLVISEKINVEVRSFLGQRGFKKGDLSSFVEDAVRWRIFDLTQTQARENFLGIDCHEAESLIEEVLMNVRQDGLAGGFFDSFKPLQSTAAALPSTLRKATLPAVKKRR